MEKQYFKQKYCVFKQVIDCKVANFGRKVKLISLVNSKSVFENHLSLILILIRALILMLCELAQ